MTDNRSAGALFKEDGIIWACYTEGAQPAFYAGTTQGEEQPDHCLETAKQLSVGVSADGLIFRKSELPFSNKEQVRAIISQEIADSVITRLQDPCLSMHIIDAEVGSRVFYAALERSEVQHKVKQCSASIRVKPSALIVAELGTWPLLKEKSLVNAEGSFLVVDASDSPYALYRIEGNFLQDLRLVSPAAHSAGEEEIDRELCWLIEEMVNGNFEEQLILLGKSAEDWSKLPLQLTDRIVLSKPEDLAKGISNWEHARVAGLALAAKNGRDSDSLLNFLWGELSPTMKFLPWLKPWAPVAIAASILLLLLGGQAGWHYMQLKEESQQLSLAMRSQFEKILPGTPLVDPVAQLNREKEKYQIPIQQKKNHRMGEWISIVQMNVPKKTAVKWTQTHYDKTGLNLTGDVQSYDQLDQLQASLRNASGVHGVDVKKAHINSTTKKVHFRLALK